jgi:hypothetical protein
MNRKAFVIGMAIALASISAVAADQVDLTVQGRLMPSSCDISVRDGALNLGVIRASELEETVETHYVDKENELEIVCDGPTKFTLGATDLSDGGGSGHESFGLGLGSNGKPMGHFVISERHGGFNADGPGAYLTATTDGQVWTASSSKPMPFSQADYLLGLNKTEGSSSGPDFIQKATIWLYIPVWIAPKVDLVLEDELTLVGNVSFELRYP